MVRIRQKKGQDPTKKGPDPRKGQDPTKMVRIREKVRIRQKRSGSEKRSGSDKKGQDPTGLASAILISITDASLKFVKQIL